MVSNDSSIHTLPTIIFIQSEGPRPEKSVFDHFITKILIFGSFFKHFFRNELHASFLPYFDIQNTICEIKKFPSYGIYGGQKGPKIILVRVCIKIFFIKGKNLNRFCTGCPISGLRGERMNIRGENIHMGIRNKT